MGNLFSRKKHQEAGHRHIYIGDIQEIEDDDEAPWGSGSTRRKSVEPGIPRIPEEVEEGQAGPSDYPVKRTARDEITSIHNEAPHPPVKTTIRRNSIAPKRKGPTAAPSQKQFVGNTIISSRYTLWNFLPKNVFEQFRRIVNFYFLCMAIVQSSIDSPVSPLTAAAPLVFVVFVTAIKQGYEDWIRHKADDVVNSRTVHVVKNGELVKIKSKDIKVGNILKLEGEEQVPADILVIGSSDEFLRCQILTANLDGETNLKNRYCPAGLPPLKTETDFKHLNAIVECEQPNSDLYVFNGTLLMPTEGLRQSRGSTASITTPNHQSEAVLPNGAVLNKAESPKLPLASTSRKMSTEIDGSTRRGSGSSVDFNPTSRFFQIACSMENMVLRGTKVKNTDFIYGLVVYTGKDTRLAQNSKQTHVKFSTVERTVNYFLILFIVILLLLVTACTIVHFIFLANPNMYSTWYFKSDEEVTAANIFQTFAQFLILFNYIIPISLYVTMELQKFIGSKFFVWDLDMTCSKTGQQALCNTSDLNEEFGQIEYLFSDKTGTLTENVMQFRYCSVNSVRYDFKDNEELLYRRDDANRINEPIAVDAVPDVQMFLLTLALCHTVQVMPKRRPSFEVTLDPEDLKKLSSRAKAADSAYSLVEPKSFSADKKWEYQASSPDEKALVEACYRLGVKYMGEKEDVLTVEVCGKEEKFKRHYVLEFDANRKCMSVIVENSQGEIWLLIKGAESSLIPKCDSGPGQETMKHIVEFALTGMRTLAVARKRLTKQELQTFGNHLKKARRLLKHREEKMRELYRSMESHLEVVGATAVEDQLQEGVPETLQALSAAGIHVWMLTGDKLETAINVAISCGLLTSSTKQLLISNITSKEDITRRFTEIRSELVEGENATLVIDGESLAAAFNYCQDDLQHVALTVFRVVCCRMAPLQKAQVVQMVKNSKGSPVTAAVGDGANDVAMIQEAHIGLGILGKEGRQAARCSDFALAKFSFLRKAILVHGHWYYVRLSILAIYFFYKNIVFILPQVYYSAFSAFSTLSLFDGYFLTFFNIFFSACPIFTFGLQEQPYSAKTLMERPQYYKDLSRNRLLRWSEFMIWNSFALFHSAVCFFIPYFAWSAFEDINDWGSFGTLVFIAVCAVSNMKMVIETKYFSGWTIFSHFYSYGTLFLLTAIYTEVDLSFMGMPPTELFGVYFKLQTKFPFWLVVILVTVFALMPDLVYKALRSSWSSVVKAFKRSPKPPEIRKNEYVVEVPESPAAIPPASSPKIEVPVEPSPKPVSRKKGVNPLSPKNTSASILDRVAASAKRKGNSHIIHPKV